MNRHRGHGAEQDENGTTGAAGGCAEFGPSLEAYYHHALEPQATQSVAEHAAGCAACRAALERFAATDRLIADAPAPVPGRELRQRLAIRIAAERAARSTGAAAPMSIERTTVVHDMNDMNDSPRTRSETRATQTGRHWQRMRVWLGTAAAVLIVALLAGTLLTRMHGTTSGLGNYSPPKGACAPGAIKTHVPANSEFGSITMLSPDEGWGLGAVTDPASGIPVSSLILHYKNCVWTAMPTSYPNAGLSSISMGSATDGWAVGSTNSGAPFALHYTNGVWKQVTPPGEGVLHSLFGYAAVYMLSADEGWIVVRYAKDSQGYGSSGLLHLANGRWSEVDTPFPVTEVVLPVAPNEVWVTGSASNRQEELVLYHYEAGKWTKATAPSGITIYTMRMVSPDNIWASGQMDRGSSGAAGAMLHYDGSHWRQVPTSASGNPQDVEAFDQGTAWAFTQDTVTVTKGNTPPDSTLTIGSAQYQSYGSWRQVAWPFANISLIGSLTRVSTDEYWAIGYYWMTSQTPTGNGGYSGSGYTVGVLLYFANGAWHRYTQ